MRARQAYHGQREGLQCRKAVAFGVAVDAAEDSLGLAFLASLLPDGGDDGEFWS
jgi:hypothetical protein